ncbi:MAG: hypothetical protein H6Q72_1212 [Firmicutes bacterium]|nr:hypothetical protein [Bacillota bacterium]
MSVLFFEKLGVYCLEARSEEDFCEQIARICDLLQPAAEKSTVEECSQELELLRKHINK